jgi:hypothetical protein
MTVHSLLRAVFVEPMLLLRTDNVVTPHRWELSPDVGWLRLGSNFDDGTASYSGGDCPSGPRIDKEGPPAKCTPLVCGESRIEDVTARRHLRV